MVHASIQQNARDNRGDRCRHRSDGGIAADGDGLGCRRMRGFENGGNHINEMRKLGADAALVLDAGGPGDNHGIARAAEVGGDLFHPLEGRVTRPGPTDGIVGLAVGTADDVEVLQVVRQRSRETVEGLDFIERAIGSAFGTGDVGVSFSSLGSFSG